MIDKIIKFGIKTHFPLFFEYRKHWMLARWLADNNAQKYLSYVIYVRSDVQIHLISTKRLSWIFDNVKHPWYRYGYMDIAFRIENDALLAADKSMIEEERYFFADEQDAIMFKMLFG